jgi:hypothetical protein
MSYLILVLLLVTLWRACLAQGWFDINDQWSRVSWMGIGCGLVLAILATNPWVSLLVAMGSLGLIWHQPMSVTYRGTLAPTLVLVAVYVGLSPFMQPWMVPWLLGGLTAVAAWTGVWALYSSFQEVGKEYDHTLFWGFLRFHDRDGGAPLAGQGNFNHSQSIGALGTAAGIALWYLGYVWVAPAILLTLAAVFLSTEGRITGRWVCQGWVHLFWAMCATTAVFIGGVIPWVLMGLIAVCALLWAHPWNPRPHWYDSNRFRTWKLALWNVWWPANQPRDPLAALTQAQADRVEMEKAHLLAAEQGNAALHNQITLAKQQNDAQQREWGTMVKVAQGMPLSKPERILARQMAVRRWRVRLLGFGTGTWYPLMKWPALVTTGTRRPDGVWEGMVYLSAHNEYVEVLFEQGVLGLAAVVGLIVTGLWALWTGGTLGLAVLIPVIVLLSIAFTNFPFTLFKEVERNPTDPPEVKPQFVGSPALQMMSLVVLLLVEAAT